MKFEILCTSRNEANKKGGRGDEVTTACLSGENLAAPSLISIA